MAFVFYPDDPRKERKYRQFKPREQPWVCPEHQKGAMGMKRNKNPEMGPIGHLIVDNRPQIMLPEKPRNPLFIQPHELCY